RAHSAPVDNSGSRAVQFPVGRDSRGHRHPARAAPRGGPRRPRGGARGGRTMTAGIRLQYTPDLAAAIDAPGLAAYGIDAAPAALSDLRPRRAPGPLALV